MIEIPQYNYDWGYSQAYIELMCMDTTILHYPDEKDKKQDKLDKVEEAKRIYLERKAQKEKEKQQESIKIKLNE